MSENEMVYGWFEKSDLPINPEDTDEFYDMEAKLGCYFVKVENQLYAFHIIQEHDAYGCSFVIEPSDKTRFVALWYNGGAGLHEVVAEAIKSHINNEKQGL